MASHNDHTSTITQEELLTPSNYRSWAQNTAAKLRSRGLYRIITGKWTAPDDLGKDATAADKLAHQKLVDEFELAQEKAAGLIYLHVGREMQTHLQGIDDNAQAMWTKLEKLHLDQRPGTRFNAYDDLFSIRKSESESLTAVIARVNDASALVKSLRPASFTLKELDQELAVMVMI